MEIITLSYMRPPDSLTLCPGALLYEDANGLVTLNILDPTKSIVVDGLTLIERGYLGVLYVSSSEWHDVCAVYTGEKIFKGYYSDIATPMKRLSDGYTMTDLFLDLWVFPNGRYIVLDQDQFDEAVVKGWLSKNEVERAESELENMVKAVKSKRFPPQKIRNLIALPGNVEEIASALRRLPGKVECKHVM